MIYIEMGGRGNEGFTTHLLSWSFCLSFSNFLGGRPFFLSLEYPASTPPEYATAPELRDRYSFLLRAPRSLVSNLVDMPGNRVFQIDRHVKNKLELQFLFSHFATTDELKRQFEHTGVWDFFSFGRIPHTREEFESYDLVEWTHTGGTMLSVFYFLRRAEKDELLRSARVRYTSEIERLAADIIASLGTFYSIHTRLGDFRRTYAQEGYDVNIERYRQFAAINLPDDSIPIVIATDALHERQIFERVFTGRRIIFLDELILDEHRDRFMALEFYDFNVLTALNHIVAAAGEVFLGTYRSTFTAIIQRMRQERYGRKDFHFLPDDRVIKQLNSEMRLTPDRSGFFDWNLYSHLAYDHVSLAWRREWDFDRTSIDF